MTYDDPTFVPIDGFRIAAYPHGPDSGTPIVMIHGWPELAYSWATTVPALAQAGYRALPYDLLGFGRSSAPRGLSHYRIENLVGHLEAVLDHFGIAQAVMLGHDWGGIVLWHAVRMLKHRTLAAISISTPHVGRPPVDPMAIFERRFGRDHYFVQFRDNPDDVEALYDSDPDAFFRMMFRTSPQGLELTPELTHLPNRFAAYLERGAPDDGNMVLTPEQRRVYSEAYARTGFLPGMNYYRNTTANWALAEGLSTRIDVPTLMISPEDDFFLPPSSTDGMVETVPDLTRVTIPDCGHWAMWDQPEALNAAILGWLRERGF
ncbi:alpha/beta hydrolase [uncultured Algimonas sp.]|uniref:alpha/beta fold hydrolase n=1 Tax=uncultured Algimonas sp. TaxID=1547920 RepID=UPI0026200BF5|nr:alpha/beta hydrolase [uncultured Algimonas sp.]